MKNCHWIVGRVLKMGWCSWSEWLCSSVSLSHERIVSEELVSHLFVNNYEILDWYSHPIPISVYRHIAEPVNIKYVLSEIESPSGVSFDLHTLGMVY